MADMMERLLYKVADYMLEKSGLSKEELGEQIKKFLGFGNYAADALIRIEANQKLLIEAENDRRKHEGRDPIAYASSADGLNGIGTTYRDASGSGGGTG